MRKTNYDLDALDTATSQYLDQSIMPENQLAETSQLGKFLDPKQPASHPSATTKTSYAKELKDQIAQKQEKRYQDLLTERENDFRLLKERAENDPFGRQGAGAPLRDSYGNIITAKNKALQNLYDSPQRTSKFTGPEPVFSLKARLARENLVLKSLDGGISNRSDAAPRSLSQPNVSITPPKTSTSIFAAPLETPRMPMNEQAQQPPQTSFIANNSPAMPSTFYPPPPYYYYPPPPIIIAPPPFTPYSPPYNNYPSEGPRTARPRRENIFTPMEDERPILLETPGRNMSGLSGGLPYPDSEDKLREREIKKKRVQTYVEYQNDLLRQMDEKQKRREQEESRKKLEEELEEHRIKRENAEMTAKDQMEASKKKQMYDKLDKEHHKIHNDLNYVIPIKGKGKRPRTPIEEVEERMRLERLAKEGVVKIMVPGENKVDTTKTTQKDKASKDENPNRDQLSLQQAMLQDQLTELKQKLMEINRERILNGYEVEDLKHKLKQQHAVDEVKRAELYHAVLESQRYPSILPTITHLTLDKEEGPFEFPKSSKAITRRNDDIGDTLDVKIASQTHTLPLDHRYKTTNVDPIERLRARPPSNGFVTEDSQSSLKYLSYFNTQEHHKGINVDDNTKQLDFGDSLEAPLKFTNYTQQGLNVNEIIKKNKERLEVLEDLETRESVKYGDVSYVDNLKVKGKLTDELSQVLDIDSRENLLIQKLNEPRRYLEDF